MSTEPAVRISVWSDYVCPFCYLELPVLDRLAAELDGCEIDWHAFELRPEPEPTLDPDGEYLHRVWNQSVYPMAEERGMVLRLPPVQPRSREAFEAAEFARSKGRFDPMHRALFRAFFEDGRDLADRDVLLDIAQAIGLGERELSEALESGRFTPKVVSDRQLAREIGITGVPALLISAGRNGYLLGGAQPYEAIRPVIEQARQAGASAA
jgi:predicted DsbA family dithiol-disulfide isomerase